jgi:hypothetical protein
MTSTFTTTTTFTRTHAKHLAAKVIADLYQCHLMYDHPTRSRIDEYEIELVEMLANSYVETYEFGFKKDDKRIVSWRYASGPDGGLHGDDSAGGIYAKASVADGSYFNFMSYSSEWFKLTAALQTSFENGLPFQRSTGTLPADGDGYWVVDHGYTAGGVRVARSTFRPS